jgi:hypothetical protein
MHGEATAADASPDSRPLAEAIVGSWTSPLLSVTFDQDGGLTAHMPDGSNPGGRWSVDQSGRLNADVMGTPMVAEASVHGDVLTRVMDDQRLNLQRSAG